MPPDPSAKIILTNLKNILTRLDRIEEKIDKCCNSNCIDFSLEPAGPFLPLTRSIGVYSLAFGGSSLEIKDYPSDGINGLYFPKKLKIQISPSCKKMEIEIANFGNLDWDIYDTTGTILKSTPPSPAMLKTNSQTFIVNGNIQEIVFKSNNEAKIKKICVS